LAQPPYFLYSFFVNYIIHCSLFVHNPQFADLVEKMKIQENLDPLEIDWERVWQKSIKKGMKKEKNWDEIAKDYGKWLENDDYPDVLLSQMRISSDDTVLDIGCAEGTITRKIAKKAKFCPFFFERDKSIHSDMIFLP